MNYKNMAQSMMGNPYLPPDTRYNGGPFQMPQVPRPQGWMQSGGYTDVTKGGTSSFSKTDPSVYEIIQQIMQGMNRPPIQAGPALQNQIRNPLPDNAG